MRHQFTLVSLAIFVLIGCSSGQLTKDQPIAATSNSGVIVLGMDLQSDFKSPTFTFLRYDPRTGKVDLQNGVKTVSRSKDDLSGGQKFAAAMTGQTSLSKGRQYFVFELPAGEWILSSVSSYYNDGLGNSYSAASNMSKGTIAFPSSAGVARYVGEYRVVGKLGEALELHALDEDLGAAQTELKKYPHIELPLQPSKPSTATYTCEKTKILWGPETCVWKTVMVQITPPPAG